MENHTIEEICLPKSKLPRVVVIGAGFAGIEVAQRLKNKPVQVVLLDKNNFHQFQPLLYQVATSGLEAENIVFPIRKMFAKQRNFNYRMAEAKQIHPHNKRVLTDIGSVSYDFLVIATGSKTNFFGLADMEKNAVGMKTIQEALDIRSMVLENLEKACVCCNVAERNALTNFVIIGGGPAGVEMAGALAEFRKYILPKDYPELKPEQMAIYLIEANQRVLAALSEKASSSAGSYLDKMGVKMLLGTRVGGYDGEKIMADNKEIPTKNVIWTAGVMGNHPKGLNEKVVLGNHRLSVDQQNRVMGYDDIFAIGDIAAMVCEKYPKGHPMVAQAAIQQGALLARNILSVIHDWPTENFEYRDKGTLATVGKKRAVADLPRFQFGGFIAWILWSIVHLFAISGFRNKLMVGINWVWSYLKYEKGDRVIIRKYRKH